MPRPPGAAVMLDVAIRTKSTRRISLRQQAGSLALCTWPAELKPQAEALYRTGRAQRLLDFLAERPEAWQARPNVHLAFWNAPGAQWLYPHCHLEITEYVHRWSGNDFAQIRAHHYDHIREDLWPWLRERQYARPEDGVPASEVRTAIAELLTALDEPLPPAFTDARLIAT